MAVFPRLDFESTVQVEDKTRLDASRTFLSPSEAEIVSVQIRPEASADFVDVTNENFVLDWVYETEGEKTVTVKVNNGTEHEKEFSLMVVSEADDALWSSDEDLKVWEPDILGYLMPGRDSFKNIHRAAKKKIIDRLDQLGFFSTKNPYERLSSENFTEVEDVREWSTFKALELIYSGATNKPDDDADTKRQDYRGKAFGKEKRVLLRLDKNEDGKTDHGEGVTMGTIGVTRR